MVQKQTINIIEHFQSLAYLLSKCQKAVYKMENIIFQIFNAFCSNLIENGMTMPDEIGKDSVHA